MAKRQPKLHQPTVKRMVKFIRSLADADHVRGTAQASHILDVADMVQFQGDLDAPKRKRR
jgi:hypothetical protein